MDQDNQILQTETQDPQDLSAEWAKFSIKDLKEPPKTFADILSKKCETLDLSSVLRMDDYLIFLAFSPNDIEDKDHDDYGKYSADLLAVDLRDLSVQQVQIDDNDATFYDTNYTLQRKNENQIIAFTQRFYPLMITINSFQPLSASWEDLCFENGTKYKTLQIYKDYLYTLDPDEKPMNNLLLFDLKEETWQTYETIIEYPGKDAQSVILKDNLYFYNCLHSKENEFDFEKDIFMFNFDTMEWKRFHQEDSHFYSLHIFGEVYKEHLVVFIRTFHHNQERGHYEIYELHCWNSNTNSWKILKIKEAGLDRFLSDPIVYKDSLLILGRSDEKICLATFNLSNLDLEDPPILSEEQQNLKALFMSEKESDIKLKVQDKIIPAHKEVLIQKSRFFAGLFKSGMAETKQDVIEIQDCDFVIFQEFLRFIYCNTIKLYDELLAFKLIDFADKHLQDDLVERCHEYLKWNISSKSVFHIYDEAHAKDFQDIMRWCLNYLGTSITLANISERVEFLIPKQNEYARELRDRVLNWILKNYFEIYHKQTQSLRLCEEFLVKNVEKDTIVRLSQFLSAEGYRDCERDFIKGYRDFVEEDARKKKVQWTQESWNNVVKEAEKIFEQETMRLREVVYCFMQENWKEMKQEDIAEHLSKKVFMDMISFMVENPNLNQKKSENQENGFQESDVKGKKRMEPIQKDNEVDESPELKKTKK